MRSHDARRVSSRVWCSFPNVTKISCGEALLSRHASIAGRNFTARLFSSGRKQCGDNARATPSDESHQRDVRRERSAQLHAGIQVSGVTRNRTGPHGDGHDVGLRLLTAQRPVMLAARKRTRAPGIADHTRITHGWPRASVSARAEKDRRHALPGASGRDRLPPDDRAGRQGPGYRSEGRGPDEARWRATVGFTAEHRIKVRHRRSFRPDVNENVYWLELTDTPSVQRTSGFFSRLFGSHSKK